MKIVSLFLVVLFFGITSSAQQYAYPAPGPHGGPRPVHPVYPVRPVYPVYPVYPVAPIAPVGTNCSAVTTCFNGFTIGCSALAPQALGSYEPRTCSWEFVGGAYVRCTGYIAGPHGYFWGTDYRRCF